MLTGLPPSWHGATNWGGFRNLCPAESFVNEFEIGDPRNFLTPDVIVDFTSLAVKRVGSDRVQVSGAAGVMEINGILAQMIFEHNNYHHDFYVEESYVMEGRKGKKRPDKK